MTFSSMLIVGATSQIASHTAYALVPHCRRFVLAARNSERLALLADDLRHRGAEAVYTLPYDAEQDTDRDLIEEACALLGELPTVVLIAHAVLPRDDQAYRSKQTTREVLQINTSSVLVLCATIASHFEERGYGTVAVISSVAADRARRSNFLYAATKAALDVYLDGLALRWQAQSPALRVLTIKPGFVRTPMTAHLERVPFSVSAERVGRSIARLIIHGSTGRRYIPWWWRPVMLIARCLPRWVMQRIRL
ncbi:MAG: short-chain dehydrogenase [Candidatus Kapaibacterium sp.]|nr:MAG: short-chain dehydrogenase [Candidatus Kapabacteria bacterium]